MRTDRIHSARARAIKALTCTQQEETAAGTTLLGRCPTSSTMHHVTSLALQGRASRRVLHLEEQCNRHVGACRGILVRACACRRISGAIQLNPIHWTVCCCNPCKPRQSCGRH